jgi:hypothetical protein
VAYLVGRYWAWWKEEFMGRVIKCSKKFGAERMDLQFRGEFFNMFNIVNMGLPANILAGSGLGRYPKRPAHRGKFSCLLRSSTEEIF